MKRRHFLQTIAALTLPASASAQYPEGEQPPVLDAGLFPGSPEAEVPTQRQWRELTAVQRHLFPSEPDAPGAREIQAAPYLRGVLSDPKIRQELQPLLLDGLERLQRLSRAAGGDAFTALGEEERERVLRLLEKEPMGRRFLYELLRYIIEACLADPVYGGNPDGIGWRWLDFQPGYQRPAPEKRYFLLRWPGNA